MNSSSCPFCDQVVPSEELQRHANGHFEDEGSDNKQHQLARDYELAQQMAFSSTAYINDNQETIDMPQEIKFEGSLNSSKLSCDKVKEELNVDEKISRLIGLQNRSAFYKVEGGLMSLLRNCLELESHDSRHSTSILSGYVDHYQTIEFEDLGWGCGWRNIQMLCSHLLMQRPETRNVLFGGSGIVPDIPSLQRWLEMAWERGFDVHGAEHFNYKIYGRKNWIGTTECAALLRSFGLQARIVDFGPKECEELYLSVPGSSRGAQMVNSIDANKRKAVYGPMDRYLVRRNDSATQTGSSGHEKSKYFQTSQSAMKTKSTKNTKGHQVLVDWIWNYFSDRRICEYGHQHVIICEKSPLFFQHDGHSRTIVGIQFKQQHNGFQQYNLLILDPAHSTDGLVKSLRDNIGWQKLIKRGIHTLNKPQYQLCYIDPGVAVGADMDLLKTIDSIFLEF